MQEDDSQTPRMKQEKERGREKSNKIREQRGEFHFPPAIPSAGGIIAGILVLG